MTITLDQLKGMNLQVGEPIEMTIDDSEIGPFNEMVYFKGIQESKSSNELVWMSLYGNRIANEMNQAKTSLNIIEKVRRLKYAD